MNLFLQSSLHPFSETPICISFLSLSLSLLQLCELLDDDHTRQLEIEARQFATYIQKQEMDGPDRNEATPSDLSSKFFPSGMFTDELTWEGQLLSSRADADSVAFSIEEKKDEGGPVWNFKPFQKKRFGDLVANLHQTIEMRSRIQRGESDEVDLSSDCVADRCLLMVRGVKVIEGDCWCC